MWGMLAILAWPMIEIGLFVVIGGRIGLLNTLAWVILTGFAGVLVLRAEAARNQVRLREGLSALGRPQDGMGRGMFRMMAGLLLILPGFLTDALGLILLIPPLQDLLSARMMARVKVVQTGTRAGHHEAEVIEAEWEEVPPPSGRGPGRSGWTDEGH
ncbi:FxsA family protein [Rhodobacter sp. Har01]|uniref:FxsA family protein n=1 Tax=Rhodobacter sp. Har01 TaxID=2883999 RepID=UPI001D05E3A7|nr:FxsA family protein [Rhodobacter sp. Har01]MCB6177916.1 FxsA family protein [Rhodobacter sp. Har01]